MVSDAPESASTSAGALLRAARLEKGLDIEALAAALRVNARKLEALEADRYDLLPDSGFTRALALSVCRALKVDAAPVLAALPKVTHTEGLEHVTRGLNQPFEAGGWLGGKGVADRLGNAMHPALLAPAILLGAAAALYFFWPSHTVPSQPTQTTQEVPTPMMPASAVAAAPEAEPASAVFIPAPEMPVEGSASGSASGPVPAAASAAPLAAAPARPATAVVPGASAAASVPASVVGKAASAATAASAAQVKPQAVASTPGLPSAASKPALAAAASKPTTQIQASAAVAAPAAAKPAASAAAAAKGASVAAPVAASASPAASQASLRNALIALRAQSASWVEVRDANGRTLFSRMLQAGEAVPLEGKLPVRLTIGNAQGTQVSFRGQAVSLEPHTRDNVARLELK